jgi:adenosylhomocysteine nucleosidase
MASDSTKRHIIVLAPMPLEMDAIVRAFGLGPSGEQLEPWIGNVGDSAVTVVHTGMGPPLTRRILNRIFQEGVLGDRRVDHVVSAGICGGLDPAVEVGTLINPELVIDHSNGFAYRHEPPTGLAVSGNLMTTEGPTLDRQLSQTFLAQGCVGVDMESAAVAGVCDARGCSWSIYRCIGDRYFDGLLDPRVLALTNQDGSGNVNEIAKLMEAEPEVAKNLERLGRETANAARLAAQAALKGCMALAAST